ncbi:MAG: phosphatidylglycerophosphatase A [Planctomycetes bacterium]|nr:phosphatidylglycerophosphatase A [Planctomycetota bacterium]
MRRRLGVLAATFFGLGLAPIAPGTFGTAGALAVQAALLAAGLAATWTPAAVATAAALVGVSVGTWAENHFRKKDPGPFVLDEVAGYFLTLAWIDPAYGTAIAAFVLFRIFDIAKPFPVNRAERLPGGWGIVLDDLVAGAYANLSLRFLVHCFPAIAAA